MIVNFLCFKLKTTFVATSFCAVLTLQQHSVNIVSPSSEITKSFVGEFSLSDCSQLSFQLVHCVFFLSIGLRHLYSTQQAEREDSSLIGVVELRR